MIRWTVCFTALAILVAAMAEAATLEVPQNGGNASGIGYFSGWKCPPNNNISIVVDGGTPIPVPSGVRRGDTSSACGNDGSNGYISQINFNLLGPGAHTAVARQNGVPFAQSTFTVTTFGQNFLTGASGTYTLQNFPSAGKTTTVQWNQGAQNFVITQTTGGGTVQCPVNGPITNLQVSCPNIAYVYAKPDTVAYLLTNGQNAGVCVRVQESPADLACFIGPVSSPTTFALVGGNLNDSDFVPLRSDSNGSLTNNGNVLNIAVGLPGGPLVSYANLQFAQTTTPQGEGAVAGADPADSVLEVLRAMLEAGPESLSQASGDESSSSLEGFLGSAGGGR